MPPSPARTPGDRMHYVAAKVAARIEAIRADRYALTPAARDAILEFDRQETGERDPLTRLKHLSWLPIAGVRLGPDFLRPTPETREKFKRAFPERGNTSGSEGYGRETRSGVWYTLRAFWGRRVFRGHPRVDDELPPWLRLKFSKNGETGLTSAEILTRADVAQLAGFMTGIRDRAWIWTSFHSARRPGEVFDLLVGDVAIRDEGYAVISIRGEKTSENRTVYVYDEAVAALALWLSHHPRKDDRAAPLWINDRGEGAGTGISYKALEKSLDRAAAQASKLGLSKPVSPYRLRHAGLTFLASNPAVNDSALEAQAGWTPGSRRKARYVRLSGRDLESVMNRAHGIAPPVPEQKPKTVQRCLRCRGLNEPNSSFCSRCGAALHLAAAQLAETSRKDVQLLEGVLKDPVILEALAQRLADRIGSSER